MIVYVYDCICIWLYMYMIIYVYDYICIWLYMYMIIYVYDCICIWLYMYMIIYGCFLSHGGTPFIIRFRLGFSMKKTIQLLGYLHLWKPPYIQMLDSPTGQIFDVFSTGIQHLMIQMRHLRSWWFMEKIILQKRHVLPCIIMLLMMMLNAGLANGKNQMLPSGNLLHSYWKWPSRNSWFSH